MAIIHGNFLKEVVGCVSLREMIVNSKKIVRTEFVPSCSSLESMRRKVSKYE